MGACKFILACISNTLDSYPISCVVTERGHEDAVSVHNGYFAVSWPKRAASGSLDSLIPPPRFRCSLLRVFNFVSMVRVSPECCEYLASSSLITSNRISGVAVGIKWEMVLHNSTSCFITSV